MTDYRPLEDYGLIGDMRTAALVARDGSIDWCCLPAFDSSSVFARLLDARGGGYWRIAPRRPADGRQRYEPSTNVLVTRFETETGVLEVTDFMPCLEWDRQLASHHEIHRRVEAVEGSVEVETVVRPRFDYARRSPTFRRRRYGLLASDGDDEVITIASDEALDWRIDEEAGEARCSFPLEAGDHAWLLLRYDDDEVWPPDRYDADAKLESTRAFWRQWAADLRYEGEYEEIVTRSALVLKLLFFAPTGAIVAAPTTSLPERIGGQRNWDYRFSWLRDSTYTLFGLYALGKFEELDRYMVFLKKICRRRADHLQILYDIRAEQPVPETTLDHLDGYRGSRPVRIGNAAVHQFQLDVYGEVMDSIHIWRRQCDMTEGMWQVIKSLADDVVRLWTRPDLGVWEVRSEPRHFVFSKIMAWVALDRAVRAAEELDLPGDVDAWRAARGRIHEEVLDRGWNEERQAFVQHYDTDQMDAANLLIGVLRFLPHEDPRVHSTIRRIVEDLREPNTGLLYRYLTDDGLPGSEGCFLVNSFHLSQALALCGRVDEATEVFERARSYASPLGLMSEEVDPATGTLIGNFPQAFSHIGLINAAWVLHRARRDVPADTFALLPE
ncbi:MAG: glycoside hydrolase family 15 protein [Gemmatimonadota bacterium]|nr:glycoside hydrolase family 15 protein [Gemmatimonadota bacterium]